MGLLTQGPADLCHDASSDYLMSHGNVRSRFNNVDPFLATLWSLFMLPQKNVGMQWVRFQDAYATLSLQLICACKVLAESKAKRSNQPDS